jgi:Holliday junction resolvase RusA-like endonuclease
VQKIKTDIAGRTKPLEAAVLAEFWIEGKIIPKKRGRTFKRGGKSITTLPANYRKWQDAAIATLQKQARYNRIIIEQYPVNLCGWFFGQTTGDINNLGGAVEDALVKAGILSDDSKKYVWENHFQFASAPVEGCLIRVCESTLVTPPPYQQARETAAHVRVR